MEWFYRDEPLEIWFYSAAVAAFLAAELVPLRGTQTVLAAKRGNSRLVIYLKGFIYN